LPSNLIALGTCLLFTGTVPAHKTYTVQKGDTVQTIAQRLHVPSSALVSSNNIKGNHLKVGLVLHVPAAPQKNFAAYTVKEGDNDWVLAHKLGTTIASLKEMNPNADWRHLKIGSAIRIPGHTNVATGPSIKSRYAIVKGDHAIIRRGPSSDEGLVTMVDSGTKVVVLDFESGWYKLKFPKGTVGWMRGDLLKAAQPPAEVVAAVHNRKPHTVVAAAAVSRPRSAVSVLPSTSVKVMTAPLAAIAEPKPIGADAAAVAVESSKPVEPGIAATVAATDPAAVAATPAPVAKTEAPKATAKPEPVHKPASNGGGQVSALDLLDKAYKLRGTRYRYGGISSRSGLDCSGFTSTVFRSEGIQLPRTSRSQSTVGYAVNRGDLKAGDLVFFRTHRSSRINHVGIYAGNGKFIHAASGFGAVRVDNLKGHYDHEMATARRIPKVAHNEEAPKKDASKKPTPSKAKADPPEIPLALANAPAKEPIKESNNSGH
jgi:peptidoglycan endopeptidase LytF